MKRIAAILVVMVAVCGSTGARALSVSIGLASNFTEAAPSSVNPYSDGFRSGIAMALEDLQAAFSARGLALATTEFDYGAKYLNAIATAQAALQSPVVAVIGYNASSEALLAGPFYQSGRLPLIIPTATSTRLSALGAYVRPMAMTNSAMAQHMVAAAFSLQKKSAVLLPAADCAYCLDLANAFERVFRERGGTILATEHLLTTMQDYSAVITRLRELPADLIVEPNHELLTARLVQALLAAGITTTFLGGDGWENADGKILFRNIRDLRFQGYYVTDWHPDLKNERSAAFTRRFQQRYAHVPNDDAVLAYDSMQLLGHALLSTPIVTRETLQQTLESIRHFDGLCGQSRFLTHGAPEKPAVLVKVDVAAERFVLVQSLPPPTTRPSS